MKYVLGIDPGLNGALVVLDADNEILERQVMPTIGNEIDLAELSALLQRISFDYAGVHCILERSQAMPKQGVSSTFKYGRGFGALEGMIALLGIPVSYVEPRVWTKKLHAGLDKKLGPKERSLLAVKRLFPNLDLRATSRSVKFHEGLVDALLIARFGLSM